MVVQSLRYVYAIGEGAVFHLTSSKRLKNAGITVLLIFGSLNLFEYISYLQNTLLFEFIHYTVAMQTTDPSYLVVGIGLLIFSIISSNGVLIKKEQDLTI